MAASRSIVVAVASPNTRSAIGMKYSATSVAAAANASLDMLSGGKDMSAFAQHQSHSSTSGKRKRRAARAAPQADHQQSASLSRGASPSRRQI